MKKIARILLIAAACLFALASCTKDPDNPKDPTDNPNNGNEDPEDNSLIVIDGQFEDWDGVPNLAVSEVPDDAAKESLIVMKVCSDENKIYIYFEQILGEDQAEAPFNVMFNTDNNTETGADSYLWDAPGWDYYIESEKGFLASATLVQDMPDMVLYKFIGPDGADAWDDPDEDDDNDTPYLEKTDASDFTVTAGVVKNGVAKVEVSVLREVLGKTAATIKVGMIGYNADWSDSGVLPQGEGGAVAPLMDVKLK